MSKRFVLILMIGSIFAPFAAVAGEPDLADQVTIRRTAYGVPHILADTEKAAAYGFAWAQCEDHFPLVYKNIARGRSEMAKHYGGEGNVEFDFLTKLFNTRERAVDTYHLLDSDYRSVIAGFAAGINAYMEAHPEEVEDWMTPITQHVIAAAGQIMVMRFTFNRGNIIQTLRENMENEKESATLLDRVPEEDFGSNTFSLAPGRTKSGNAILLNNPHQPWSEQAHYYEAHITVPGKYNFYGSTFVGGPILTTGFNERLGWAHTVNYPDLEEIYELTLDTDNPGHYLFDGTSVKIESEKALVETEEGETLERTHHYTPLGPVIYKKDDKIYVLRSVGYTQYRSGEQWYRMAKAQTLDEFKDVLRMQEIAMFNIGYADADGNIYYCWNGTIPDIPHQNTLWQPIPASDSDNIWTDILPFDALPQYLNPEGGYVMNANDPPYWTNLHEPLDPDDYPPYFPETELDLRSQHTLELVHNDNVYSLEDVVKLKFSQRMLLADRVKDDLITAVQTNDPSRTASLAVKRLKEWNNTTERNSQGSVLFKMWWNRYESEGGEFAHEWSPDEPMTTPRGLADPDLAAKAFDWAIEETKNRWGRWDVTWGHVHRLRRGDVDAPLGGGHYKLGSFRVLRFEEDDDGKLVMNSGDSYIFAVEFGDQPRAYSVLGYSQSGREDSPHYDDQSVLYAANQMKPVAFTEKEIEDQLLREYAPKK